MSSAAIASRRAFPTLAGKVLLLAGCGFAVAGLAGFLGLQSRHALVIAAVPVLLAPLALWLFFSERYEVTLAVLLLYLGLFDGVIKLASGSNVATLGRDVLLYSIVLGAVARVALRRTPLTLPPLTGIVLAWVMVCLVQLANPSNISLLHAAAALRQHLEFVPLFFLGYLVLRTERRVAGLLLLLVLAAVANGVADLIQSRMSPAQLASWGPGYAGLEFGTASRVARVFITAANQAAIRPPGLGGTDGFGGRVGLIALPGAIALLGIGWRRLRLGWLLVPATLLTIVGIVTSQTRLDVVGAAVALFAFLALTITSRRGLTALLVTAIIAGAGGVIVSAFVSSQGNRYASIAPSRVLHTAVTARQRSMALIPRYIVAYPLGAGVGSAGPAGESRVGGSTASRKLDGETQFTFTLVETGIPGLLVMIAYMAATLRAGLSLRGVATPRLQPYLMALTAALIALLAAWIIAPVTADSPTSPFIWLTGGCLAYWHGELRAGRLPIRVRRLPSSLSVH